MADTSVSGALDITDILDAVNAESYSTQNLLSQIQTSHETIQQQGTQREILAKQMGQNSALVKSAEEQALLQAQNNTRNAASALGVNMDDSSEIMTMLAKDIRESYTAAKAASQEVAARQSSSFLSNPLGYISDQLALPASIDKYNDAATQYNLATAHMAELNSLAQTSQRTQYAIAAVRSDATVQAAAENVRLEAEANVAELKQKNAAQNIAGLQAVQQMNSELLNNRFRALSAMDAATRIEMQKEQWALAKENALLLRREREARLEKTGDDPAFVASVNEGLAILGRPAMSSAQIKRYTSLGAQYKQIIGAAHDLGAMKELTGTYQLGNDAVDAASIIRSLNVPVTPQEKPVVDMISANIGAVQTSGQFTKPEEIRAAALRNIAAQTTQQQRNIKVGDNTNIYQVPDLGSIARNNIGVADSALYQKVLKPIVLASGNAATEVNPEQIASLAITAIKNKEITYEQAVRGMTDIYRAGAALNQVTRNYSKYNLPIPTEYNMLLTTRSDFGMRYNMLDEQDVAKYLVRSSLFGAGEGSILDVPSKTAASLSRAIPGSNF